MITRMSEAECPACQGTVFVDKRVLPDLVTRGCSSCGLLLSIIERSGPGISEFALVDEDAYIRSVGAARRRQAAQILAPLRRLVAPGVLRRYLATGPRDLTAGSACRAAADRRGDFAVAGNGNCRSQSLRLFLTTRQGWTWGEAHRGRQLPRQRSCWLPALWAQLIQKPLRHDQIGGAETLREAVVDRLEAGDGVGGATLTAQQAGEARRRAQLP